MSADDIRSTKPVRIPSLRPRTGAQPVVTPSAARADSAPADPARRAGAR